MEAILQIKDLEKSFGTLKAINKTSFDVYPGECFGLLGPNGAGKSTTIECIEQITKFDGGEILFEGRPLSKKDLSYFGVQFQATALPADLKVKEVLTFFSALYPESRPFDELVEMCDLGEYLDHYHNKISGGQRQRLLLAVAICHNPKVLMLDEPTTGLDPHARRNLWDLVLKIKSQGTTVILTTHYMDEAYELCDRIGIMQKGEFIALGTPDELLSTYFDEMVIELPIQTELNQVLASIPEILEINKGERNFIFVTKDLNTVLKKLSEKNIDLTKMKIRQSDLEDLFIHLTHQKGEK